jgi:hypothetical protein
VKLWPAGVFAGNAVAVMPRTAPERGLVEPSWGSGVDFGLGEFLARRVILLGAVSMRTAHIAPGFLVPGRKAAAAKSWPAFSGESWLVDLVWAGAGLTSGRRTAFRQHLGQVFQTQTCCIEPQLVLTVVDLDKRSPSPDCRPSATFRLDNAADLGRPRSSGS